MEELALLKQRLRSAGIDPAKMVKGELRATATALTTRRTSQRVKEKTSSGDLPHIPTELVLQILKYALTSEHPIADPLGKLQKDNLTAQEKKFAKNQIAYGFLSTSRLYNQEGKKIFWSRNSFMFTTVAALRNFASLAIDDRRLIQSLNLRVIAKYYDEDKTTTRYMSRNYSHVLGKKTAIKVYHPPAPQDFGVIKHGFQAFSWLQLVDFLRALQPPYAPGDTIEKRRPKLLPNLINMRIDLVNFQGGLPGTGDAMGQLHAEAHHNQPYFLHELMITGLPCGPIGNEAGGNLMSMLKFDGLFLDGLPSYIQDKKNLVSIDGPRMNEKVFRSNFATLRSDADILQDHAYHHTVYLPNRPPPTVPAMSGHPTSSEHTSGREVIWKHVPISRDSSERQWVEFDRGTGLRMSVVEQAMVAYYLDMMEAEDDLELDDMWSDVVNMDEDEFGLVVAEALGCAKCHKPTCRFD